MSDRADRTPAFSRTFKAFQYRDFRLLWLGAFTSTTGNWMQLVAQSWLVLQLTSSPFYLGLVGFLGQLPIILFTLVGGVFADRFERRKLLLVSQYVQMAVAIVLTVLVYLDIVRIGHFLILVFIAGSAQAFGGPAYQALIPTLVKREDVPNAVALNSIQFNLARVVGPIAAGAAFASLGAVFCFGLNALSFLAVVISLLMISTRFMPQRTEQTVMAQIGDGFRYIKQQGALWQLTVLGFISTFCGVPLLTLLPVFAKDVFGLEATGYSTMMAVSGVGSILGALTYATFARASHQGRIALWVQLAFALLLGLFAVSRSLVLSCLILFLTGFCLITLFAAITSLVQLATSEEMRGRMMSIFMLAFRGGMPLGDLSAGTIADRFSPTTALLILSGVMAIAATGFLVSRSGVKRL